MKMVKTGAKNDSDLTDKNQSLKVAIQGYYGAFHEIAARKYFQEKDLEIIQALTFEEVIGMVSSGGGADTGLMAIENTLGGSIMNNYRLLQESKVSVIGEAYLRIKQHLIGLPGTAIQDLKEVHSHPMAIAQCREYFKSYPFIKLIEMEDTALSAKRLSENKNPEVGVIASKLASELYDLEILEE
ncbi:MAG: prephenate dehydratase domain-containing protein, partial [Saprospiraceae bacterium]